MTCITQTAAPGVEDEPADSPTGDWQSQGNQGSVRIERCGQALCGYAPKSSSSCLGRYHEPLMDAAIREALR